MDLEGLKRLSGEATAEDRWGETVHYADQAECDAALIAALGSVREELLAVVEAAKRGAENCPCGGSIGICAALAALDAALEKQEAQG